MAREVQPLPGEGIEEVKTVVIELRDDEAVMESWLTDRCTKECEHLAALHEYDRDCGTRWCGVDHCSCHSSD